MSDKDEHLAELVNRVFTQWHKKVRKIVAAAQRTGQVRKDINADILAHHIIMTIEGGIMLARLKKNEKHLRECMLSLRTLLGLKI
jgi:TetR/AcrR family transcriptional regulator, transcriptional repressor for nem operon